MNDSILSERNNRTVVSNESTELILRFIRNYRALENSTYAEGFNFFRKFIDASGQSHLYEHLCSHWKGKRKDFGSFFMNLDTPNQIRILHLWGIHDPGDQAYLSLDADPITFLVAQPPATISKLVKILIFFNNHGIESFPPYASLPGLHLTVLPQAKRRYGNTANWGHYILSLVSPEYVLDQILRYSIAGNKSN